MTQSIKFIFGSVPKAGGTFTFYRTIRPKLLDYGIDMRCVSVGKRDASLWEDAFADEGCVLLSSDTENIKIQAQVFVDWCEKNEVDIVVGINSVAILSAIPHLPEKVCVISRLASIFDISYIVVGYDRLMRIVTTAPRHAEELIKNYGVEKSRICMIPNGIDPLLFYKASKNQRGNASELRLGFLGRLEHVSKGVLFLPKILRYLDAKDVKYVFKIAGKGVFEKGLKREFKKHIQNRKVEFVGNIPPKEVPNFLANIDVLLFTSKSEGCPNTLLEAMMAGCVPVASLLKGITDFILQEGKTGFLCPVGDCEAFAVRVCELAKNREKLRKMSQAVAMDARERFSQARMAADYARVLKKVMAEPAPKWTPRPWSEFQVDPAFKQTWRRHLPDSVKKGVRNMMFHLGLSKRYE